jgi:hypothetical protein
MLSGTPVINNLFELSKLFNILSGSRPTINIYITGKLDSSKSQIIKDADWSLIKYTVEKNTYLDQIVIHKDLNWIQASKVPDDFINVYDSNKKYLGVQYAPEMPIPKSYPLEIPPTDMKRLYNMGEQWENFSLQICKAITNLGYKFRFIETVESCLPEDEDVFNHFFMDPETHRMMNKKLFMERILGLTSSYHFRDESLFPKLKKVNLVRVPMTTYQYLMYTKYRKTELEKVSDKINFKKELDIKFSPAFRIRSRLCCTFAFPKEVGDPYAANKIELLESLENKLEMTAIEGETQKGGGKKKKAAASPAKPEEKKPAASPAKPEEKKAAASPAKPIPIVKADAKKAVPEKKQSKKILPKNQEEPSDMTKESAQLDAQIKTAFLNLLDKDADKYLSMTNGSLAKYGPKMAALIARLALCPGTALIYSQFRTLIGLNVMALALQQTGNYTPFKISKTEGKWKIADFDKWNPKQMRYVFYTGGEGQIEREIYRHIFNNSYQQLDDPSCTELIKQLNTLKKDNMYGDIIKVLLTTKTGTEGLNLFGVRQVHILEPYWQHVLVEQVIGRAIRYKSHLHLPLAERDVEVFIYISTLDDRYLLDKDDVMQIDVYPNPDPYLKKTGILTSSDEFLWILSQKKKAMIADCLELISKSSIDCGINLHEPTIGCFAPRAINGTSSYITTPRIADKPDMVVIDSSKASKMERQRIQATTDDDEPITYCPIPNKNGDIVYFLQGNVPAGIMRINRRGDYKVIY